MKTQCLKGGGDDMHVEPLPADSAAEHVRRRFKGKYKRAYYVCLKVRTNLRFGKNPKKDTGADRENFPRPNSGCKRCNVALCHNQDCWRIFHTQFQGASQPYSMKYCSLVRRCLTKHALSKIINNYM